MRIALIPGDGIGPEIVAAAVDVLRVTAPDLTYVNVIAGGASIDRFGVPLCEAELEKCKNADAVLLGAVGGPKWDGLPGDLRPERALLGVRAALKLYANLRPARLHAALRRACPLKRTEGIDLLVVRELIGGIYFGEHGRSADGSCAHDTMTYSAAEVERIGRVAFRCAQARHGKLCSVDKANVLESSRLWRENMHRLRGEYPDVAYSDMLVDNCAMQMIRDPGQFDVLVTGNLFGDILSDEAAMLTGSIGMLPSASLGDGAQGLFEPVHGSAPELAGRDLANPIATILSAAMMLRHSLARPTEADAIERAVDETLKAGFRTADIAEPGEPAVGTRAMCDEILKRLF